MSRVRFALAGAGIISKQHGIVLDQLKEQAELVAVADPVLSKAEALTQERGGRAFPSLGDALAGTDIDVVVVCTPTGTHGDLAIQALEAGKHVIIEKPAEITVERADRILAAQERAGKLVTVISQHRFDPSTEIVVEAVRRGEFGRLTSGIASIDWWRGQSYYDSGDWRGTWALDGGGALMNQGVHTVDLLVAAMGRPVEVFGYTAVLAHERVETEDVAVGVVRFESGALGVLHGSTAVYPGLVARLQVHGDRGSAVIENDRLTYFHSTPVDVQPEDAFFGSQGGDTNQADRFAGADGKPVVAGSSVAGQMSDAHLYQYENFLAALRGEEEVRVGLRENRQAIAIITGLYESARTGAPVRLA
ncbi:putative dehydrogenase [Diaminobutyricimonas aerilata]|uniref:Putative dehydrogenase n=1 Tax=Diaminobutyricimonas aerilata TaxID=1162967 RepID=A0A2M9CFX9_9MICO|nr:Gfo/Idh/MocA family oxidoreductase [Diaminobutyricimonas aerilata]PJJ70752.1 putative dehydrogenase [Diaminobutyricimonas aerilata]